MMLKSDPQLRVARLLRGERKAIDLNFLFSDCRFVEPGFEAVREIGHLAAHRNERDRGIVLSRVNDMQLSARHWFRQQAGIRPSLETVEEVGRANLRILPEKRLKELFQGSRLIVGQRFGMALKRYKSGKPLNRSDKAMVDKLGFSMTWQYAFDEDELAANFADCLIATGALEAAARERFLEATPFVALYALALLHGAQLKLADGAVATLKLRLRDETGTLRIKANIPIDDSIVPATTSVAVFETSLPAARYCDAALLAHDTGPIEVSDDERLVALR